MASSASSLHRASMDRLSVNTTGTARKASSLRSLAVSASDSPSEQPRTSLRRAASSNLTPSSAPSTPSIHTPRQTSSSSSSRYHHRGDAHIPRMKSTPRLVYDKDAEQAPSTGMYWSRAPVYGAIPNRSMRAHSITVIDNVVWLFGGCDDRESWKDIYCLNVESMQWTHPECLGDTPPPSRAHSATLVANHKIVFIGGGHGSVYYDSVYVLDTLTRRWSRPTIAPGPSPPQRRAHTAVLYENKIWVFGGGNGMMALDDVWTLDVAPLTGAIGGGTGSGGYHGVYHVGGGGFYGPYAPSSSSSGKTKDGNVTLTWDLVETKGIKKPESRGYHTANLVGNIMVIIGGSDGKDSFDELWTLNLDTLVWTQIKTNIPYRRLAHSSTQVGSYLFIFGGHDSTEYTSELVLLNLVSLQYETRPVYGKVPSPRGYHATALADSRVLLIGGFNGHQSFDDVHILELAASAYLPQVTSFAIEALIP
ncbi:hypothetical protein AGABI2DRAFT_186268 [Agaricus bisporus var. bisporus H97]|uniref:hypothetical protein n=1 Tax=Agaricus bisporus var. bisporus (strain H97 / ATCC MYA-4626 / FGSC 10389) TaxID=936046 RepID=UPI00029F6DE5|nr:hypothetical protein AGABI2DRAFT_186268 [Agaricus bisporus var. bisporus H97]EKV46956.1 hypothetical protein AGABI2DRAFT_186268 [Agaricus bisporus var. bisporus H97]